MTKDPDLIEELVAFGRGVMAEAKKADVRDQIQALNAMVKIAALKYNIQPEESNEGSKLHEYRKSIKDNSSGGKDSKASEKEEAIRGSAYATDPDTAAAYAAKAEQKLRDSGNDECSLPSVGPALNSFSIIDSSVQPKSDGDIATRTTKIGRRRNV